MKNETTSEQGIGQRANLEWASAERASILVVDDAAANLEVLTGMLKERGYKARPVPSGKLALLAARKDPPNLILLDINMPEMNGYEVCEHLKADDQLNGIPVIFISGLSDSLDKVKAFAVGGVDYLTKPFQMEELQARVATHLELRRLQCELQGYTRRLEQEYSHRMESARERHKLDLELACEVQRGILPLRLPEVSGYEFFASYEPAAEVGGDYYDVLPLPRQRVAILLGEVAGKGVAAALLVAKLCADARFCLLTEADPAVAMTRLNGLMMRSGISERYASLLAAILDPTNHTVTLVNAGHPSPLIYRRGRCTMEVAISSEATHPLGTVDGFEYASCQISLESGDCLLACTADVSRAGVNEAIDTNNVQLQMQGIYPAIEAEPYSLRGLGERVVKVVQEFSAGRNQHDDIAVVGFGRK
jgi:serine phosphatase RsbU (regulator of sigma subunit)